MFQTIITGATIAITATTAMAGEWIKTLPENRTIQDLVMESVFTGTLIEDYSLLKNETAKLFNEFEHAYVSELIGSVYAASLSCYTYYQQKQQLTENEADVINKAGTILNNIGYLMENIPVDSDQYKMVELSMARSGQSIGFRGDMIILLTSETPEYFDSRMFGDCGNLVLKFEEFMAK